MEKNKSNDYNKNEKIEKESNIQYIKYKRIACELLLYNINDHFGWMWKENRTNNSR